MMIISLNGESLNVPAAAHPPRPVTMDLRPPKRRWRENSLQSTGILYAPNGWRSWQALSVYHGGVLNWRRPR